MVCPITIPTDAERLISFCSNFTINGPYSGSVVLADCACELDPGCEEICTPVEIGIDNLGFEVNCCDTDDAEDLEYLTACYAEDPLWLAGLLRTYGRDVDAGTVTSNVSSYFDYLQTKPINTQQFNGTDLATVLNTLFTYYTGTPSNLYCLESFENVKIKGPVEGNSSYAELYALAQAGCANLFVQVGGCLTVELWKDHDDPTEFVIPGALLISARPSEYRFPNTSVIRARGASLPKVECGTEILSNDIEGNQGSIRKCTIAGVPTQSTSTTFNNLRGNEKDILAANVFSTNTCIIDDKFNVGDGTFGSETLLIDASNPACLVDGLVDCDAVYAAVSAGDTTCLSYYSVVPTCTDYIVTGGLQSVFDESLYGSYHGPGYGGGWGSNSKNFGNQYMNWVKGNFPVPYSMFGFGAFGSQNFFSSTTGENKNQGSSFTDQPSFQQCETVATVPNIGTCGISIEEINNKYVPCKEQLFKLAVRRFQEIKMAQNSWDVEVAYTPCLKINQMVEFTVPETVDCPTQTVRGLIGGMNVCHNAQEGCTTMKLSIQDVSCIGQTFYTSGNLVQSPCAGQDSGGLNPWQTSALGIDQQSSVQSGVLTLFAQGTGNAYAYYTHSEMTPGATYNWSYDYETLTGWGSTITSFPITAGTGGSNLVGSGTESGSFIAGGTSVQFTFDLITPPVATYMRITNIVITKTVLA